MDWEFMLMPHAMKQSFESKCVPKRSLENENEKPCRGGAVSAARQEEVTAYPDVSRGKTQLYSSVILWMTSPRRRSAGKTSKV